MLFFWKTRMCEPFPSQIQPAIPVCDPIVGKAPGDAEPVPDTAAMSCARSLPAGRWLLQPLGLC